MSDPRKPDQPVNPNQNGPPSSSTGMGQQGQAQRQPHGNQQQQQQQQQQSGNTKDGEASRTDATVQFGALDEDDEFEEFEAEDWGEEDEDHTDLHAWDDNWDDDDVEDDFAKQLRAELSRRMQTSQ